jgi:hypothetical protein
VDPNRDCAWVQIYERLKKMKQLDRLYVIQQPRDHSKSAHPRRFTTEMA